MLKILGKVLLSVAAFIASVYIALLFGLKYGNSYLVFVLLPLLLIAIWTKLKLRFRVGIAAIALLFVLCSDIGMELYRSHLNEITIKDSLNLHDYAPFSNTTKAISLDEPSTFRFSGEIPRMDGATALYPVYSAFVKATCANDDTIRCSTTSGAYRSLIDGEIDIIFVAGASDDQLKYAESNGVELKFTPIGKEAFVFFVNKKNPVNNLSSDDIRKIYSGQATNWRDVGGKNKKILAFQRSKNSGSQTMLEKIMGNVHIMDAPSEDVQDVMSGMIEVVANYKNRDNAIGYSFRFFSTEMVNNSKIKLLSIDGVSPTYENITNDTYPFAAEFYAVTTSAEFDPFIDWILSAQGQSIIEKTGYTPIK